MDPSRKVFSHFFEIFIYFVLLIKKSNKNYKCNSVKRYILIRSDGTTEPLSANQFIFTGGTELQIYGLGSNDTDATLITSISKLKPTSKEKIRNRVKIEKTPLAYEGA